MNPASLTWYGGFQLVMGDPENGWFIPWKIPSRNGWWQGVALWLRKLPYGWSKWMASYDLGSFYARSTLGSYSCKNHPEVILKLRFPETKQKIKSFHSAGIYREQKRLMGLAPSTPLVSKDGIFRAHQPPRESSSIHSATRWCPPSDVNVGL